MDKRSDCDQKRILHQGASITRGKLFQRLLRNLGKNMMTWTDVSSLDLVIYIFLIICLRLKASTLFILQLWLKPKVGNHLTDKGIFKQDTESLPAPGVALQLPLCLWPAWNNASGKKPRDLQRSIKCQFYCFIWLLILKLPRSLSNDSIT